MRICKAVTLLLILAIVGACANSPDSATKSEAEAAEKAKAEAAKAVTIPAGTSLSVVLSTSLNSGKNNAGDTFTGNLAEPVVIDGKTVLEKGTKVEGKVVSAEGSGRVKGRATMSLTLTNASVNGKDVPLTTKAHSAEADPTKGRDAAVIGGGAGVGAAIGAIAGGKKGAAVGAAVGGAGGTGAVLATKGKEVEYPVESTLTFTLDQDVSVAP
jgi:cytoskeletal protein RodZ